MNHEKLLKLAKIILVLKAKVKCPICLCFLENTVQLGCAHAFCNNCLQELRLQNTPLCPLCKAPIHKRTAVYKDRFADDLGKFVDRTCQLFKETYAHEVEELSINNKGKLQEIIDSAPEGACILPTSSAPKVEEFKKPTQSAFDKLMGQPRSYINKKRLLEQKKNPKVLNFIDSDNKTRIISWLNDNQRKLDTLTQSPGILTASDDEADFELPSISQVANQRKRKLNKRVRSQSLNLVDDLNEPLVKRYHSLTHGLNEDDYGIEEVHSETLVKQVERKVLQDMLEDECLTNMEQLAEKNKSKLRKGKVTPRGKRKSVGKNRTPNVPNSGSSTGWDRIKEVKKSLKQATKEPKKLNISLQESNNMKKSVTRDAAKESPVQKSVAKTKKSPKRCLAKQEVAAVAKKSTTVGTNVDNKENDIRHNEIETKLNSSNERPSNVFNLSNVENFFEENFDKVKVTPDKYTSPDMEIDLVPISTKKIKDLNQEKGKSGGNNNVSDQNDDSVDDEIILVATQSAPRVTQTNEICRVAPVPIDFNDIDSIAMRLTFNLRSCISSASNLERGASCSMVDCFTNLKTYVDKIITLRSDRIEQEIQTSQLKQVAKMNRAIQTETVHVSSKKIQTKLSPVKKLSTKNIQTSQNILQNAEVQTNVDVYVGQAVQAQENLSTRKITKERSVEGSIRHSASDSSEAGVNTSKRKLCKQTVPTTLTYRAEEPQDVEKAISTKTSQSSDQKHISVDSSKPSKPASRELSEESILICSVGLTTSDKSDKKLKRKLTYGEEENRTFKRIRKPDSDSESDDDGKRRKRRLLRDDLTVEFIDTEQGSKEYYPGKDAVSPESDKMDYDKYLLEVMAKYGTPPPDKTSGDELQFEHEIKPNNTSVNKNIREQSNSEKSKSQISKRESQKDSGEHVFTAAAIFEENLDKFEKEIFDYEVTRKAHNTEYDLVENTPMLSPKAKIPRLQVSSKKKDIKRDCMKEPVQIISKGSAPICSTSKKPEQLDDSLSNLTEKEPSTLNRNIENVLSQTEKCTDDVAGLLKDLQDDDDFFKSDSDENEQINVNVPKRRENVSDVLGADDLPASKDGNVRRDSLNVTQENIDEVVGSLNGFEDGDDIEAELEKISFTAEQRKVDEANKTRINVWQNIKLKSQDKKKNQDEKSVGGSPLDRIIESSDVSDEEIVETTPQKKKNNSRDRSIDELDLCLPPPPGFGDEIDTSPVPDDAVDSPPVHDPDEHPLGGNKSSLTPDSLTDFIIAPDMRTRRPKVTPSQSEWSQQSLTFKPAFITPNRPSKARGAILHITPRGSQIIPSCDSADMFSPITKSTIKFSQTKFTPLVSTSRLSTKKSNLMTSTPNQKSILNYVKQSQENQSPSELKPCIMWTRIMNRDLSVFTQLEVKKLVTTATSFNPRVTHLVVLVDEKGQIVSHTAKILIAVAAGIWVVRYEWAQDCLKLNRIVPEEPYEAVDTSGVPGPQISRLTREKKPLFKGFRFYCAAPILTISKGDLENILQLSGGEIARNLADFLQNDEKINIILTESSASEDTEQFENFLQVYKAVTIDVEWLTKCIGQYKLVSFRAFLVSGDDSNLCDLGYPPTLIESVPFTLTEAM